MNRQESVIGAVEPSNALQAELASSPCAYMLATQQMDVDAA
jgi:hypothetical protein